MRATAYIIAVVTLIPALAHLYAQPAATRPPAFEVASVKPNKSESDFSLLFLPGGRLTATNVPLRVLIATAYGNPQLRDFQISGGPNWVSSDRFDVVAKGTAGDLDQNGRLPPGRARLMMRTLLADRFKLTVHNETRNLPIYQLVVVTGGGHLGPQLRQSGSECAPVRPPSGAPPPPPPPPPAPGQRPSCGIGGGLGRISGGGATMSQLASVLAARVNRVVLDKTGLIGTFDLNLEWTPDQIPPAPGEEAPRSAPPPDGPSIFTAVQEQLGLKLESTKGPVDVLVIDHVERPTDD